MVSTQSGQRKRGNVGRKVNPAAADRAARAVELRKRGHTFETIAKHLGYASRASAYKAVRRSLDRRIASEVDELRQLESERLDALWRSIWPCAIAGDLRAVD